MNLKKLSVAVGLLVITGGVMASNTQAQVIMFGPPVIGPRVVARAYVPAPFPVVRRVYAAPVVTMYRPVVPTYSTYRPIVAAPVYAAPIIAPRFRPAVVGPGIGGYPNVYRLGQPVRNALRFAIP